jgi:hypothetical protein
MAFAVGLWDAIFGEKIEINLSAPDGSPINRKVTKKWLEQMEREGKMSRIERDSSQVRVHMLHPSSGYSVEVWTVGTDVDAGTVRQYQDEAGDIYAITAFKGGKPRVAVIRKDLWEEGRKAF